MFQTFEPVSDISYASAHLPKLRAAMVEQGLDGFLVPHDDEYQNEYIPEYAERLMWVSGFSGSAGFAIIFSDRAVIFVDGRYTLQVREQTDANFFEFVDISDCPPERWLSAHAQPGQRLGYDPMLHTVAGLAKFEAAALKTGFDLIAVAVNPIDSAWKDQPDRPLAKVTPHPDAFAGRTSADKRDAITASIRGAGADAVLLTTPPSVAWAFNIRGGDVSRTPLPLSRALVFADGTAEVFFAPEKNSNSLADHLGADVSVRAETDVIPALESLGRDKKRVLIDPALTPAAFAEALTNMGAHLVEGEDPCALPRATKTDAEISGTRAAHIIDGVAVTRFLHWLANEAQSGDIDEITAAQKLEALRTGSDQLKDLSFDSISGAGPNGAICHYRVSTKTNRKLERGTLYLIDSGGQYPNGTTDVTRTVAIGSPTEEMRTCYTLVLKGHIALATIRFPSGTTGHQLDALARAPLWRSGRDYEHGTGHGVGSFLGVHEGPQRIAKWPNSVGLRPGMILSNEPGYYKPGEFGIRIENLVVVSEPTIVDGGDQPMMAFETLTLAPLERALIRNDLLTDDERDWVDRYHQRVRETIGPRLAEDIHGWLNEATRPL